MAFTYWPLAGATGPAGPTGPTGPAGAAGTNGATWLTGTGVPGGGLGVVNDFYLDSVTGNYYQKTGVATWTLQGSLIGPPGPGGGGGLVFLESQTALASASLDFNVTITSTYDEYEIHILNLIPVTGSALRLRFSTDGGATFDSSADYSWQQIGFRPGGSGTGGGTGQTQLEVVNQVNTAGYGTCALIKLYSPLDATLVTQVTMIENGVDGGGRLGGVTTGQQDVTQAVNAFQLILSTGLIASGIVRTYGVVKS